MTKDEIISGNVIIATYLGQHDYGDYFDVEKHEYPDSSSFYENATDSSYHKSNLLYHYRRDWLDDAIEEIQKVDNNFGIGEDVDIMDAFKIVVSWIQHYA
jgi:hypothetical protein